MVLSTNKHPARKFSSSTIETEAGVREITERKNWIRLITMLILPLGISAILFNSSLFNIQKIEEFGTEFHYNTISMSATIGGFLFTGISILISAIDKDRVKRLWDNNYLNNLYRAAIVGMISNVVSIVAAFFLMILELEDAVKAKLTYIEISSLIIGVVFFSWCIKQLAFVVGKLKNC